MKRGAPAANTDEYLAAMPAKTRVALTKLRRTIHAAVPKAVEAISYHIPTFKYLGPLVGFGGFEDHCSFFVMSPDVMDAHKQELRRYDTSKGTIRFPADKPLPAALVKRLVRARIRENEKHVSARKKK